MVRATDEQIEELAQWGADLFEARTIKLVEGSTDVTLVLPGYRVSWSEFYCRLPDGVDKVDARIRFQPSFDKVMCKRGLLKLLRGKQTADDWYSKRKIGR